MTKRQHSLLEEDLVPLIHAFPDVTTMVCCAGAWPRKPQDAVGMDMGASRWGRTGWCKCINHHAFSAMLMAACNQWSSRNVDLIGKTVIRNPSSLPDSMLVCTSTMASLCLPSSACEVEMVIVIVTLLAKHIRNLWLSPVWVLRRLESCFLLQSDDYNCSHAQVY